MIQEHGCDLATKAELSEYLRLTVMIENPKKVAES